MGSKKRTDSFGQQDDIKSKKVMLKKHKSFIEHPQKRFSSKQQDIESNLPPNVSDDCFDAIEKMLIKKPDQRISLFELLNSHPWLFNYQKNATKMDWDHTSSEEESVDLNKSTVSEKLNEEEGEGPEESSKTEDEESSLKVEKKESKIISDYNNFNQKPLKSSQQGDPVHTNKSQLFN